jgi:glyoxylate carboligase
LMVEGDMLPVLRLSLSAAQWYPLCEPRRWVTSGGLGSMGFGLPSALGAAAAHDGKRGRPKRVVVDIDGDGSFLMNCQELATAAIEKLNCKVSWAGWRGAAVGVVVCCHRPFASRSWPLLKVAA